MEFMIEPFAFVGSGQLLVKIMAALQKGFEPIKLTVAEVKRRMDRGERFAFVDARRPEECTSMDSTLPSATRMLATEVDKRLKAIPQGRTIITYCACPNEESSTQVALELMRRGFLHVHPLIGGIDAWRANCSVGST